VRAPSWVVLGAPDGQPIPGVGDRVVEDSAECHFHRIMWLASGRSHCGQLAEAGERLWIVAASSVRPCDAPSIVWGVIAPTVLGSRAGITGAAAMVADAIFGIEAVDAVVS
jgi:hypothetical protein